MAQRDLVNLREVTKVVAESPNTLLDAGVDLAQDIIRQNQEAKINESTSQAQLELNALQSQYQIDFESDPMSGIKEYKSNRQAIFDKYSEGISPFYRKAWDDNSRRLTQQNDAAQQGWALKQTRTNTVNSINRSMKNNLLQANIDGQNFGGSDDAEISAFLNFENSKSGLMEWGARNVGSETTAKMLADYEGDYIKSFISGVADEDPIKALRLLDDKAVTGGFNDVDQYSSMKRHIENRALQANRVASQKEILSSLRDENSLLSRSMDHAVGYAELQSEMDRMKLSPASRNFFLEANGFETKTKADRTKEAKPAKEPKLDEGQKVELKEKIFSDIIELGKAKQPITPERIKGLQDSIYHASQNGALTKKETGDWLNQVLRPYITQKEETLSKFSDDDWFGDDLGLEGLKKEFDKNVEIHPSEGEKKIGVLTERTNMKNRLQLYDFYMQNLEESASRRNIPIGDIQRLSEKERRAIYGVAQDNAIKQLNTENYPELRNMKDVPNAVFPVFNKRSDIQAVYKGAGGKRDLTREDIMKVAKNKNISPAEVISLLRGNGAIE